MLTRSQWDALLRSKDADIALEALQAGGVLRGQFPVLQTLVGFGGRESGHKDLWAHTKQVVIQTLPVALLRWAALFHDVGKPVSFSRVEGKVTFHNHEQASERLFRASAIPSGLFSQDEIDHIGFIIGNLGKIESYSRTWTDSAVRRLARELDPHLDDVFSVARADCTTIHTNKRKAILTLTNELRERIRKLQEIDATPPALPSGLGDALRDALGLPSSREGGIELGKVMLALRARVEAGELPRNADYDTYIKAVKPT